MDYRDIARRITEHGDTPITFTGARSIFLRAMQKMAIEYLKEYKPDISGVYRTLEAEKLANSIDFQKAVNEHIVNIWR